MTYSVTYSITYIPGTPKNLRRSWGSSPERSKEGQLRRMNVWLFAAALFATPPVERALVLML